MKFTLSCQDQFIVSQRAEMTLAKCSLTSCVSSFPDRVPHYARTSAQSARSDFVGSRVYACLDVTCHLHFAQNDRGILRATMVTGGRWGGTDTE